MGSAANRSGRILIALVAIAVAGALSVSALGFGGNGDSRRESAGGHSGCQVGKRSTVPKQYASSAGGENLPGPIVIGCGRSNGEAVQVVGYNVRGNFCFGVYRPNRGSFEGGECKATDERWTDLCTHVCIYSVLPVDLGPGSRLQHSLVSGGVSPGAENLAVTVGHSGKRINLDIVQTKVDSPGLLKQLHQTEAFTAFVAVVPLCAPPGDIRADAGIDGHVQVVKGREQLRLPCRMS